MCRGICSAWPILKPHLVRWAVLHVFPLAISVPAFQKSQLCFVRWHVIPLAFGVQLFIGGIPPSLPSEKVSF